MSLFSVLFSGARLGMVEGLGDEEIPWWIAPYVRDFVALAQSEALAQSRAGNAASATGQPALSQLAARLAGFAPVARVAARTKELGGVGGAIAAEVDEYCGTPPHPHRLGEAALAVSAFAASLGEHDAAKAAFVAEARRLQGKIGATGR